MCITFHVISVGNQMRCFSSNCFLIIKSEIIVQVSWNIYCYSDLYIIVLSSEEKSGDFHQQGSVLLSQVWKLWFITLLTTVLDHMQVCLLSEHCVLY